MAASIPPGADLSMIPSMAPPPGVIPNFINPVTLADPIVAVCATTSSIAVVLLSMRLYSTLRITRSASYDDVTAALALVFALAYVSLIIDTREYARHGWDLSVSGYTTPFAKIVFTEQIVAALGLFLSKASILLLLLRLFSPTKRFRYMVYSGIIWSGLITIISIVVASALCAPRSGESFSSLTVAERCTHEETWAVVQGVANVCLDLYIIYLPMPLVWKLQMALWRKLGVMAIFMAGFIACLASLLGLVYKIILLRGSDTLWNTARVDILIIVELNVAIMVACMPACSCFLRYFFGKLEIVSSMRSRLSSSLSSKRNIRRKSNSTSTNSNLPQHSYEDPDASGKYWRIRNPFSSRAPQIASNKQQSRIVKTVDFEVFDEGKNSMKSLSGDIEMREPSPPRGKEATAPHVMV